MGRLLKVNLQLLIYFQNQEDRKNLPTQGYAGETYTFTNNLTGKVETHSFDGNKWNPVMVDGKQVNLNSLALFDDKGKNLAMKQGYTGKMASPVFIRRRRS